MVDDPEKAPSITSFDVARLAGVSRSAVSRAFTPGSSISAKTREKVFKAASELGYRVNLVARGLNKQRTDLVGMIASRMDNPNRARQIDALAKRLMREGFRPMLFCTDEGMDTEELISVLLNYKVSGVVITSDAPPKEICEECARLHVPLTLVDRSDDLPFVDHITGDNVKGGRIAAEALIKAGRRRLIVLNPKDRAFSVSTRIAAFVQRVTEEGLKAEILDVGTHEYESGSAAAAAIAARLDQGLGVFCPTDVVALGLLDTLRTRHGIRIPEDVSLIGYDDIPQADWEFAKLTTINQPVNAFALATVSLLKERMKNPESEQKTEMIDVSLVMRGTV